MDPRLASTAPDLPHQQPGRVAATPRRWRSPVVLVAVPLLLALASACSSEQSGAAATTEPGSTPAGDDAGEALYAESCALCHGVDLRGTAMGPSHLSQVYAPDHHPDEAFRSAIANGSPAHHWTFGDMPPVPGLSDDDVDAIIAYVRAQQRELGFEP